MTEKIKNNIITSDDVTGSKVKKSQPKKTIPMPERENNKKIVIIFESGSAYVTKSDFKFTQENKIAEIDYDEAQHLLQFDNFRLPTQEELENYHLNKES